MRASIRVGCASGFWGDSDLASAQLLRDGDLDYLVFDYLAEVTMSILARARAADPTKGYATDFVTAALRPNLARIATSGVKIVSNAGGVNPRACGEAVGRLVEAAGLELKVAVVVGDDVFPRLAEFEGVRALGTGAPCPELGKVVSANAYLGAFPIAEALERGADIVITGRCVDSAVTLGACIHAFGWTRADYDALASGSLAGHILECGTQATGGNFTDWSSVNDRPDELGYPIAEIRADGTFDVTKPSGTGGAVTVATVGEQMLYEIGDPTAYLLPDVVCDFSEVRIAQAGESRVTVVGARGRPAPASYKVSLTWNDGFRGGCLWFFVGEDAATKARRFADAAIRRSRDKLRAMQAPDFDEVLVEVHGDESHYGAFAKNTGSREVTLKIAARHQDIGAAGLILKESTGLALASPPGLTMFNAGRPKPSPVVRLYSFLLEKQRVPIHLEFGGDAIDLGAEPGGQAVSQPAENHSWPPAPAPAPVEGDCLTEVPLARLAYARSGDKGNDANIGVLPRRPEFAAWIWRSLSEDMLSARFAHFLRGAVERYYLPGTSSMNIVLRDVLGGGGVASLRNDPLGKTYAQLLLQVPVSIPVSLVEEG